MWRCSVKGLVSARSEVIFFDLDGGFAAVVMEVDDLEMEVDDLELEGGVIVRLFWGFLNRRLYFLWCLSRMFLEEKISHITERPFGMVIFYGAILF